MALNLPKAKKSGKAGKGVFPGGGKGRVKKGALSTLFAKPAMGKK